MSFFTVKSCVKTCTAQWLLALQVRKVSDHAREGVWVQGRTQWKHWHQSGCHVWRHKTCHATVCGGIGQPQGADAEARAEPVKAVSPGGRRWHVERGEGGLVPQSTERSRKSNRRPERVWVIRQGPAVRVCFVFFGAQHQLDGSDDVTFARSHHRLQGVPFLMGEDLGHDFGGVPLQARVVLGFLRLAARLRIRGGKRPLWTLCVIEHRGRTCAVVVDGSGVVPVWRQVLFVVWGGQACGVGRKEGSTHEAVVKVVLAQFVIWNVDKRQTGGLKSLETGSVRIQAVRKMLESTQSFKVNTHAIIVCGTLTVTQTANKPHIITISNREFK